ncbi:MAG: hypothetical protein B7Z68_03265 [Acidobacteria bacterium 21-70-11]|nr:MAG: hypothetical protein B7Z68_03265 [Acidobacteria bacterium 21-70-11]HQT93162.1 hypothetical protein [Thermoanaerobaculaceae bacterium]HQU33560.1 hypothetical protein [Thermoanaerobaculaceae bacterium]
MRVSAAIVTAALAVVPPEAPLEYRFAEVKSAVHVRHDGVERHVKAGETGVAGDEVRTGWRGRAVVEVASHAVRFEILSSTRARLGGPQPGVLLVLERGGLKAVFDAITGSDDRLVATPGALLAVRGTRYGVEVAGDGSGVVAVFVGTVEVRPTTPGFPVTAVAAGELCRFGPRTPPQRALLHRGASEENWRGGLRAPGSEPGFRDGQPAPDSRMPAPRPGHQGGRPGGGRG